MTLLQEIERLAKRISELPTDSAHPNHPPRLCIVGGFVRDQQLDHPSKDADVEVYGVELESLEKVLTEEYPGRVNAIGKSFAVFHIALDDHQTIDVSIPRRDSKQGEGHRGFIITGDPWMNFEDAARRRDFSINAMGYDPLTKELLDPYHGAEDLKTKTLRVVDPATFQEDPLRVYRALQFVARFNLEVESTTFDVMQTMVTRGDLEQLTKERVTEEWKKLLLAPHPSHGLKLAEQLGIIERLYPELQALRQTPQEKTWHPEGTVWTHTLMAVDRAAIIIRDPKREFDSEEQLAVMLGTLCHDLGKPLVTETIDGHLRSLGHEAAGEEVTRALCDRWCFSKSLVEAAVMIAREHLAPRRLYQEHEKGVLDERALTNATRRLLRRIAPISWRVLLAAAEADARGRALPECENGPFEPGDLMQRVILEHHLEEEIETPLLSGQDLLDLGVPAGPMIGTLQRRVEEARDEGQIRTREEAIRLIDKNT